MTESVTTTVVIEPSRKGWLCTCGSYYYQSPSAEQAHVDAADHHAVVHGFEDRNHPTTIKEDNDG